METKILKLDSLKPNSRNIKKASQVIAEGGFVAFPTETVYGIACRVETDTLARLDAVKGRGADKYYTLHIGKKSDIIKYVPVLGLGVQKLINEVWPGPLTIVFELSDEELDKQRKRLGAEIFGNLYKDNSIGIRCPDNAIAAKLLAGVKCPVVAPSANKSGEKAAVNAKEVIEQLSGKVDMVLDGGECRYKKSSSVVKVDKNGIHVLREGVILLEDIKAMSKVRFLFVCTGNTCRSPMAEGIFKQVLSEKIGCNVDQLDEKGYIVSSAGTMDMVDFPASGESVAACAAKGIDISHHQSQGLMAQLVKESDFIFAMSHSHKRQVVSLVPSAAKKCVLLIDGKDVADPIGQSQEIYNKCCEQIEKAVKKRISELLI